MFTRQQFISTNNSLSTPQIDNNVSEFKSFDDTINNFTNTTRIFRILHCSFGFTNTLDYNLLCCLGRDAAKINRWQLINQNITDNCPSLKALSGFYWNLSKLVIDFRVVGYDLSVASQGNFPRLPIYLCPDIMLHPVLGATSFLNSLLHRIENFFSIDTFFTCRRVGDLQQFPTKQMSHVVLTFVAIRRRSRRLLCMVS